MPRTDVVFIERHKTLRQAMSLALRSGYSRIPVVGENLDDIVGFWRVTPVEGAPQKSLVEYSVDIRVKGWVPSFVREVLVGRGLKSATRWVKVQAEARASRSAHRGDAP